MVLLIAGGAYYLGKNSFKDGGSPKQAACTMEAKVCPDGSSVGRTDPNCEFAQCPKPLPSPTDETANWKTYTGYYSSFVIPKETVKKGSIPPPEIVESIDFNHPNFDYTIHYQVSTYLVNLGPNYKEIILDGQPATKYTVIAGLPANIYQPTILLSYKNKWYLINISIPDNSQNQTLANKILDQIVASFKLLK